MSNSQTRQKTQARQKTLEVLDQVDVKPIHEPEQVQEPELVQENTQEQETPEQEPEPNQAQEQDPAQEIPEHLQGFPKTLSHTEKQSCFICGRFLSSKQALIRHFQAERKVPAHFEDKELVEQIDLYINLLKQKNITVNENVMCRYCERNYHNKYYRRQHETLCRFNPANKMRPFKREV